MVFRFSRAPRQHGFVYVGGMGDIIISRLYFLEEFRRDSVYSVTLLSNPAELCYPMPPEHGKGTPKKRVSTSATADLHMYILCRSAIKFTFLPKNNNHVSTSKHKRNKMLTYEL